MRRELARELGARVLAAREVAQRADLELDRRIGPLFLHTCGKSGFQATSRNPVRWPRFVTLPPNWSTCASEKLRTARSRSETPSVMKLTRGSTSFYLAGVTAAALAIRQVLDLLV